jgi:hypothetical protein
VVAEIFLAERNVISTTNDTNSLLESSELALLINCTVRIEIFSNKTTSILDIFESVRRKTTLASMVIKSSSTVNELLLTEIPELSVLLHIVRFHGSNCGESPAAAAFSLVLDRSNYSIVTPVPMSRDILNRNLKRDSLLCVLMSSRALLIISNNVEIVSEFSISHVRKFIETLLPSEVIISVMSDDFFHLS